MHGIMRPHRPSIPSPNAPGLAVEQARAKRDGMKRKSKGHGPGKGKAGITTSIPEEIDAKLRALAAKGGVSRGALARAYIIQGVESGRYIEKVWKG